MRSAKRLLLPFAVACGLYGGLVLMFALLENTFIYFPSRPVFAPPSGPEFPYRWIRLTTADGVELAGWEIDGPDSSAPWLIVFHGNAGNIGGRVDKFAMLRECGLNLLAVDYRGYGRSGGSPDEQGLYRDAEACYDHVLHRGTPPERIFLYGESLGSAVAIDLAARRPVGALIAEGAFTSIADRGSEIYPFLPVRWMVRNRFASIDKIGHVRAPKLFLHADNDEVIPLSHGRRLFEASSEPRTFVPLRGDHNGAFMIDAEHYTGAIAEFLRSIAPQP